MPNDSINMLQIAIWRRMSTNYLMNDRKTCTSGSSVLRNQRIGAWCFSQWLSAFRPDIRFQHINLTWTTLLLTNQEEGKERSQNIWCRSSSQIIHPLLELPELRPNASIMISRHCQDIRTRSITFNTLASAWKSDPPVWLAATYNG